MSRILVALAVLIVAVFGIGYVIGQATGITSGVAAGTTPSRPSTGRWMGHHFDHFGPHAAGQVSAVSGNTVTVKPTTGWRGETSTVTSIALTGSTQYVTGPGNSADKSAIKVGSFVVATGTLSSDGKTLTASRVMILPSAPDANHVGPFGGFHRFAGPHADGQVTGISGNSIAIKPDASHPGELESATTINVTGSTRYFAGRGVAPGKSSVTNGSFILATGTVSVDGKTLTATRVVVLSHAPGNGWGPAGTSSTSPNI